MFGLFEADITDHSDKIMDPVPDPRPAIVEMLEEERLAETSFNETNPQEILEGIQSEQKPQLGEDKETIINGEQVYKIFAYTSGENPVFTTVYEDSHGEEHIEYFGYIHNSKGEPQLVALPRMSCSISNEGGEVTVNLSYTPNGFPVHNIYVYKDGRNLRENPENVYGWNQVEEGNYESSFSVDPTVIGAIHGGINVAREGFGSAYYQVEGCSTEDGTVSLKPGTIVNFVLTTEKDEKTGELKKIFVPLVMAENPMQYRANSAKDAIPECKLNGRWVPDCRYLHLPVVIDNSS